MTSRPKSFDHSGEGHSCVLFSFEIFLLLEFIRLASKLHNICNKSLLLHHLSQIPFPGSSVCLFPFSFS